MVELLITVVVIAVVLALAAPSFGNYFEKRRIEGAMSELTTDLQLARSEAVSRNAAVRLTLGSGCYVVHLASASTATCTSSTFSVVPASAQIKVAQPALGSSATLAPADSLTYIQFEAQLGNATWDGTNVNAGVIDMVDSAGRTPLRASVNAVGRNQVCSPGGKNVSYASC